VFEPPALWVIRETFVYARVQAHQRDELGPISEFASDPGALLARLFYSNLGRFIASTTRSGSRFREQQGADLSELLPDRNFAPERFVGTCLCEPTRSRE
jgi:hypothetical protein